MDLNPLWQQVSKKTTLALLQTSTVLSTVAQLILWKRLNLWWGSFLNQRLYVSRSAYKVVVNPNFFFDSTTIRKTATLHVLSFSACVILLKLVFRRHGIRFLSDLWWQTNLTRTPHGPHNKSVMPLVGIPTR